MYDLENPAESLNSAPGCALTDGMCQRAGALSCGVHGKCIDEWESFTCDCYPGYAGPKCDQGMASFREKLILRERNESLGIIKTDNVIDNC